MLGGNAPISFGGSELNLLETCVKIRAEQMGETVIVEFRKTNGRISFWSAPNVIVLQRKNWICLAPIA